MFHLGEFFNNAGEKQRDLKKISDTESMVIKLASKKLQN